MLDRRNLQWFWMSRRLLSVVAAHLGPWDLECFRVQWVGIETRRESWEPASSAQAQAAASKSKQDTRVGAGLAFGERSLVSLLLFSLRLALRAATANWVETCPCHWGGGGRGRVMEA